ncbi:hypothetical protein GCM10027399_27500 [Curvibacter fontanus]
MRAFAKLRGLLSSASAEPGGVKTRAQTGFLAAHGCDTLQGSLCARPLPLQDWLSAART